jgi:hypothetical protein
MIDSFLTFQIDQTFPNSHPNGQVGTSSSANLTRLEEVDAQRTLLPIAHPSASLAVASPTQRLDTPGTAAAQRRSYLPLSRPGTAGRLIASKSVDQDRSSTPEHISTLSSKQ